MEEFKEKLLDILDENIELDKYMDDTFLNYVYDDNLYSDILEKLDTLNVYIKMRLYEIKYYVLNHEINIEKFRDISIIIELLLNLPNKYIEKFCIRKDEKYTYLKDFLTYCEKIDDYIKKLDILK